MVRHLTKLCETDRLVSLSHYKGPNDQFHISQIDCQTFSEGFLLPDSMVTVMLCLKSLAVVGDLAINPGSDRIVVNRGVKVSHVVFSEEL